MPRPTPSGLTSDEWPSIHARAASELRSSLACADGLCVLRVDTTLAPRSVALACKLLWMAEATFRAMESVLDTRPTYHQRPGVPAGTGSQACHSTNPVTVSVSGY